MEQYILLLTITGIAIFGMAWMPALTKRIGISYSVIYLVFGALLYLALPGMLPVPLPMEHEDMTLRLAELVVIISLMGTGIKIDRAFSLKNWQSPLRLVFVAMIICIGVAALLGYAFLNFNLASAVLLGAVLAPTDPVLASDVQVGPPNDRIRSETKFSLTAEAGINDGMAFPFTWLSITLAAMAAGGEGSLLQWFGSDFVYRILAGLVIGFAAGKAVGFLIFRLAKKHSKLHTSDGFLAIALTFVVYGVTEMLAGYGFIAVFVSAVTLRHYEKLNEYHDELHSFTDQVERLLVAVLLILFGGSLVSGILSSLTWQMVVFTLVFLLIVRPVAAYISLFRLNITRKEKLAISFLGIRGMGSIFYLAFAFHQMDYADEAALWSIVAFTIFCSIMLHGFTANPIMKYIKKTIGEEVRG